MPRKSPLSPPKAEKSSGTANHLSFRISEVSRMLNVSSSTLRQWENAGLTKPRRTGSGYRSYSREEVEQLKKIQHLRLEKNLNVDAIRHLMGSGPAKPLGRRSTPAPKIDAIGNRLRKLRRDRRMTLSQAAAGTGLSVSFLSCLERGQAHASVATLQRLSVFYQTNVLSFFGGADKGGKLVRPHQRVQLSSEPGVDLELLAFGSTAMEPHLFRLAPGTSSGGSYHHEGEEFLFVVSGSCDVWLDEVEHYQLREGDSLYFASSQTHRWSNPYKKPAVLLWINTPPTF
ncbi:MerR family transcriptional regulator [Silvibacterium sp.]|uniref:MerR family transcriptional regulator n=1 Tax=Silvibacterium sp. TaxID=1964179 RepID=UPI0039E300A9